MLPARVTHMRVAFGNFAVKARAAQDLIAHTGLQILRIAPHRAVCAISCAEYVAGDLGEYTETAVALMVHRPGAEPLGLGGRMMSLARGNVAVYMHSVPVSEQAPCDVGVAVWGLPKFVARTRFDTRDAKRIEGALSHEGKRVLTLSVRGGGTRTFGELAFDTVTYRDGSLRVFKSTMAGEGASMRLGGARLELGADHPLAEDLRALGLPRRAMASGYIEHSHGLFGPAELIDRAESV